MLVEKTEYLTAGVHIGMKSCTPYMKQFVYKVRDDGLAVFNLQRSLYINQYRAMEIAFLALSHSTNHDARADCRTIALCLKMGRLG